MPEVLYLVYPGNTHKIANKIIQPQDSTQNYCTPQFHMSACSLKVQLHMLIFQLILLIHNSKTGAGYQAALGNSTSLRESTVGLCSLSHVTCLQCVMYGIMNEVKLKVLIHLKANVSKLNATCPTPNTKRFSCSSPFRYQQAMMHIMVKSCSQIHVQPCFSLTRCRHILIFSLYIAKQSVPGLGQQVVLVENSYYGNILFFHWIFAHISPG